MIYFLDCRRYIIISYFECPVEKPAIVKKNKNMVLGHVSLAMTSDFIVDLWTVTAISPYMLALPVFSGDIKSITAWQWYSDPQITCSLTVTGNKFHIRDRNYVPLDKHCYVTWTLLTFSPWLWLHLTSIWTVSATTSMFVFISLYPKSCNQIELLRNFLFVWLSY